MPDGRPSWFRVPAPSQCKKKVIVLELNVSRTPIFCFSLSLSFFLLPNTKNHWIWLIVFISAWVSNMGF